MGKYICKECGETFDYPDSVTERRPCGDGFALEEFGICPSCGSGDWETAYACACCGALMPDSQALYHLCAGCEETADTALVNFYDGLSEQERNYLDDYRLGGWLADAVRYIQEEKH